MAQEDFDELAAIETELLDGVPCEKRSSVLRCMDAHMHSYAKGSLLSSCLKSPMGVVYLLKGSVRVGRLNASGERSILFDSCSDVPLAMRDAPSVFGMDDVSIVALEDCVVIDFNFSKEIEGCSCCVGYVSQVRKNTARQLGRVNSMLMRRVDMLTRRSIRSKIVAFLYLQAGIAHDASFEIDMTRQDLADYLCVERSALSREIGKMRSEGLIDCVKGRFKIKEDLSIYS